MSLIRTRIVTAAIAALLCHVVALLAPPVAMCCTELASALSSGEIICNCDHGPNAMCPMHKANKNPLPGSHQSEGSTQWCAGHSAPNPASTAVFTFQPSVIEECATLIEPGASADRLIGLIEQTRELSRPPTLPPPRG